MSEAIPTPAEVTTPAEPAAPETPTQAAPSVSKALTSPESGTPETATPSWTAGMSAEDLAYIGVKGWDKEGKGPADILKSYRNIERLRGVNAEQLTKIPDPANAEEVAAFRSKLGVPEAPDGYPEIEISTPAGDVDMGIVNQGAHKMGLTPDQHAEFAEWVGGVLSEAQTTQREQIITRDTAEQVALDHEWGAAKDENYLAARKASERFGVDEGTLNSIQDAIGYRKTMELMAKIGRGLGEHKRSDPEEDAAPFGLTRETAQQRIKMRQADQSFREKLLAGDMASKQEWADLNRIAFGSTS